MSSRFIFKLKMKIRLRVPYTVSLLQQRPKSGLCTNSPSWALLLLNCNPIVKFALLTTNCMNLFLATNCTLQPLISLLTMFALLITLCGFHQLTLISMILPSNHPHNVSLYDSSFHGLQRPCLHHQKTCGMEMHVRSSVTDFSLHSRP
ncbi:hypothetical protein K7X08_008097 [Anisodus acutangulus]|uniref:Uncharacterized protein n=1 Tax=Anisodus acutangulus TaxID=402998 RepID=A0A9Q1RP11_9SOLA|nr:hypothetical protein K7X08_008097 [Anisodus acutangulus]